MKTLDVAKATGTLAEYMEQVERGYLVLTRKGKPIAALVSLPEDTDLESLSLSTNPEFMAILEKSRESLRRNGGVSSEAMRRRFEAVE